MPAYEAGTPGVYGMDLDEIGRVVSVLDYMISHCVNGRYSEAMPDGYAGIPQALKDAALRAGFRRMSVEEVNAWTPE